MEDETRNQALLSGSNAGSTCEELPGSSSNRRSTCKQRPASSSNGRSTCKQRPASSSNGRSTCKQQPVSSSNGRSTCKQQPVSSSNSDGVAIPQPRVAGEARYPGYMYNKGSNAVSVAVSRRRYTQSDNNHLPIPTLYPAAGNAYG